MYWGLSGLRPLVLSARRARVSLTILDITLVCQDDSKSLQTDTLPRTSLLDVIYSIMITSIWSPASWSPALWSPASCSSASSSLFAEISNHFPPWVPSPIIRFAFRYTALLRVIFDLSNMSSSSSESSWPLILLNSRTPTMESGTQKNFHWKGLFWLDPHPPFDLKWIFKSPIHPPVQRNHLNL